MYDTLPDYLEMRCISALREVEMPHAGAIEIKALINVAVISSVPL